MKKNVNRLAPENCNKAMCKTCIFRTDGNQFELSSERMIEIMSYLAKGESSHVCHITEKTCYGGLSFTAKIFHAMGFIPAPTAESFLKTAGKILNL